MELEQGCIILNTLELGVEKQKKKKKKKKKKNRDQKYNVRNAFLASTICYCDTVLSLK